jgi:transposase
VLRAIVFVLFTGIASQHLPRELGCSPATAHRRLKEWQAAGVFAALHRELLRRLNAAGPIDWSMAMVDGTPAKDIAYLARRVRRGRRASQARGR